MAAAAFPAMVYHHAKAELYFVEQGRAQLNALVYPLLYLISLVEQAASVPMLDVKVQSFKKFNITVFGSHTQTNTNAHAHIHIYNLACLILHPA